MSNAALAHRIRQEYEHYIWYFRLKLRPAVIVIDDEESGTWGQWSPNDRTIRLSSQLFYTYPWQIAVEVLKHEVAHQVVTEVFQVDDQHGPFFRRAAEMLATADWAKKSALGRTDLSKASKERTLGESEARLLRRAEKLLALAQSDNAHESRLAMQRVHDLYLNHNIEAIKSRKQDQFSSRLLTLTKRRLSLHYTMIANLLSDYYFVDVVSCDWYSPQDEKNYKGFDLLGAPENIEMAEYVFRFLEGSMERTWKKFRHDATHKSSTDRNSYFRGFIEGFREQLNGTISSHSTATGQDKSELIVLNDPLLKAYVKQRYPRTQKNTYRISSADLGSYSSGHKTGKSTTLAKPIEQPRRTGLAKLFLKGTTR